MKTAIDAALELHARQLQKETLQSYTPASVTAVNAYCQILARGGKRIRGALTMVGYEMCGGKDEAMIMDASCAIEMTHAYILVLDDIMDKSSKRRGGDSAHILLANHHAKHNLSGDGYHFGEAVAINSALIGNHYAQSLVTTLAVDADNKVQALRLINDALVVTGHGQINDIYNEVVESVSNQAVDNVSEWKTAHYTFLNPLQFGMALAGATTEQLTSIYDYCMHAGRAFQITDDILGTFASELEAGKSPMDDIREGKRTVLSVAALEKATGGDKNFLLTMLGNEKLTQAEFARCKEIFIETGALAYTKQQAEKHVNEAVDSLNIDVFPLGCDGVSFLKNLALQLLGRNN